ADAGFGVWQVNGGSTGGLANVALSPLNVGGGGQITGLNAPAANGVTTGALFLRSDSGGGALWDTTLSQWVQVIYSYTSMPAAYFGLSPTTSTGQGSQTFNEGGVAEMAGCPSSSACAYTFYDGYIFV